MAHKIVGVTCGNDSDSMEEDLEMIPKSEIEKYRKANEAKKLTPDEIKMLKPTLIEIYFSNVRSIEAGCHFPREPANFVHRKFSMSQEIRIFAEQ